MTLSGAKARPTGVSAPNSTIRSKLGRKMALQAGLIATVAVLAIAVTSIIIEQLLVREALRREAEHFWQLYAEDSAFPLPHTDNLKGYLASQADDQGLPDSLRGFDLGYHKVHGQMAHSLLYISERNGQRLHLLFDGESVLRLAFLFGVFPLTIVLVLVYLTGWWVYRESNYVLSPIVWLANKFERFDPAHPDSSLQDLASIPGDVDWEVDKLMHSLSSYSTRIQRFVERERAFTRDTSHELRTPLTVIKMASDLLLSDQELDSSTEKYINRIKGAAGDMEELIDAFLILARETDKEFEDADVDVRSLLKREIKAAQIYLDQKDVEIVLDEQQPLHLHAPEKVLAIVIGNLLRNAALYTNQGKITITLRENSLEIADTGIGMSEQQLQKLGQPYFRVDAEGEEERKGYGIGLTIVKRLSDRFNWHVDIDSELEQGTRVTIDFSPAR